jgi:hypothetical protein
MDVFDERFDTRLVVGRNDCVTYANGLVLHLTGLPDAALLLQEAEQIFDASDASGLDAASW